MTGIRWVGPCRRCVGGTLGYPPTSEASRACDFPRSHSDLSHTVSAAWMGELDRNIVLTTHLGMHVRRHGRPTRRPLRRQPKEATQRYCTIRNRGGRVGHGSGTPAGGGPSGSSPPQDTSTHSRASRPLLSEECRPSHPRIPCPLVVLFGRGARPADDTHPPTGLWSPGRAAQPRAAAQQRGVEGHRGKGSRDPVEEGLLARIPPSPPPEHCQDHTLWHVPRSPVGRGGEQRIWLPVLRLGAAITLRVAGARRWGVGGGRKRPRRARCPRAGGPCTAVREGCRHAANRAAPRARPRRGAAAERAALPTRRTRVPRAAVCAAMAVISSYGWPAFARRRGHQSPLRGSCGRTPPAASPLFPPPSADGRSATPDQPAALGGGGL